MLSSIAIGILVAWIATTLFLLMAYIEEEHEEIFAIIVLFLIITAIGAGVGACNYRDKHLPKPPTAEATPCPGSSG